MATDKHPDPCTHPDPRPVNFDQPDGAKWCRWCGALYVTDVGLFGMLLGKKEGSWVHPTLDHTAPTLLNLIREHREKKTTDGDESD